MTDSLERLVIAGIEEAIGAACPPDSRLAERSGRLLGHCCAHPGWLEHRMFALDVARAAGSPPAEAVPVSVASALWWAAAEAVDDLNDGGHGTPADMITAVACGTVVAQRHLERRCPSLRHEFTAASLDAAEGQLADLAPGTGDPTWRQVMRTYAGKTGAAYGRDAAMAATLSTSDDEVIAAWRCFGRLFGVLRQAHNDVPQGDPATDEDLINGTPTLLLAHAMATLDPDRRAELARLSRAARREATARRRMRDLLTDPDLLLGYHRRITALHGHARDLLDRLTNRPGALGTRLDATAVLACHIPATPHASTRRRNTDQPITDELLSRATGELTLDTPLGQLLRAQPGADGPTFPIRALAAIHRLALIGRAPDLVTPLADPTSADPDLLWKLITDAILATPEDFTAALDCPIQQHEPARAGQLLEGLALVDASRIRLLEIGACAGLNLLVDRYRWQGNGWAWGTPDSPLALTAPGTRPGDIEIVSRVGCDLRPRGPANPADIAVLRSFLPPEAHERRAQLDTALRIAARWPAPVHQSDAAPWLARQLRRATPRTRTIVWHSLLWPHLDTAEQRSIEHQLTESRIPVTRIAYEPPRWGEPPTLQITEYP